MTHGQALLENVDSPGRRGDYWLGWAKVNAIPWVTAKACGVPSQKPRQESVFILAELSDSYALVGLRLHRMPFCHYEVQVLVPLLSSNLVLEFKEIQDNTLVVVFNIRSLSKWVQLCIYFNKIWQSELLCARRHGKHTDTQNGSILFISGSLGTTHRAREPYITNFNTRLDASELEHKEGRECFQLREGSGKTKRGDVRSELGPWAWVNRMPAG